MAVEKHLDPTSLVARIIAELQANPDAQRLLLRAILTDEFLGMPVRLNRIEKDIAELKADIAGLKADVVELKADVAYLKGSDLEHRLQRKIRPLISQALTLRRAVIVHSPVVDTKREFIERVEDALESGLITDEQDARVEATDFILHAQRRVDRMSVWVAVEASSKVHAYDIERARATADVLRSVFDADAIPVVAGYEIDVPDAERAKAQGVRYLQVSPPRPA